MENVFSTRGQIICSFSSFEEREKVKDISLILFFIKYGV